MAHILSFLALSAAVLLGYFVRGWCNGRRCDDCQAEIIRKMAKYLETPVSEKKL